MRKFGAGAPGGETPSDLKAVEMGHDEHDDPVTIAIVDWSAPASYVKPRRDKRESKSASVQQAIDSVGGLPTARVREALANLCPAMSDAARRSAFSRGIKELGLVERVEAGEDVLDLPTCPI